MADNLYRRKLPSGKLSKAYYMQFLYRGVRVHKSTGKRKVADAQAVVRAEKNRIDQEIANVEVKGDKALSVVGEKTYLAYWAESQEGSRQYRMLDTLQAILGDIDIDQITGDMLVAAREQIAETVGGKAKGSKASPATVNRYMATLSKVLHHGRDVLGVIHAVPKIPKGKERTRKRILTQAEEAKILAEVKARYPHYYEYMVLVIETGLRSAEAHQVTWDRHVDPVAKTVTVYDTKNGTDRTIPLTEAAFEALQARYQVAGNHLFKSGTGYAMNPCRAYDTLRQAAIKAEVDTTDLGIHALRHTCATRLVKSGLNLRKVQKWLGHKSITQTERYTHLDVADLVDGADRLTRLRETYEAAECGNKCGDNVVTRLPERTTPRGATLETAYDNVLKLFGNG